MSQRLLNTLCSLLPTSLFIKYLLITTYQSEEQFATLILFPLPISQYSSMNKILIKIRNSYGFLLMTNWITIWQADCSSFVCWDNYSVHSTNIIPVKIRKQYDFFGWNRTKRIDLFVRTEQYRRTIYNRIGRNIEKLPKTTFPWQNILLELKGQEVLDDKKIFGGQFLSL